MGAAALSCAQLALALLAEGCKGATSRCKGATSRCKGAASRCKGAASRFAAYADALPRVSARVPRTPRRVLEVACYRTATDRRALVGARGARPADALARARRGTKRGAGGAAANCGVALPHRKHLTALGGGRARTRGTEASLSRMTKWRMR